MGNPAINIAGKYRDSGRQTLSFGRDIGLARDLKRNAPSPNRRIGIFEIAVKCGIIEILQFQNPHYDDRGVGLGRLRITYNASTAGGVPLILTPHIVDALSNYIWSVFPASGRYFRGGFAPFVWNLKL